MLFRIFGEFFKINLKIYSIAIKLIPFQSNPINWIPFHSTQSMLCLLASPTSLIIALEKALRPIAVVYAYAVHTEWIDLPCGAQYFRLR